MTAKIAASIMCSDYAHLAGTVRELEEAEVDLIHVDIMDGVFVPNLMGDPNYLKTLRRLTKLPLDIHLMCVEPERFISIFDPRPGDYVCFHPEATYHPHKVLVDLNTRGCRAGVVLGPALAAAAVEELLPEAEYATIMTIDTGVPGSRFLSRALDKIGKLKTLGRKQDREITAHVDGSVCFDNVREVLAKGADVLILGYAGCFNPEFGTAETLRKMRELMREAQ